MRILVVGSAGREHAVCRKLRDEGSEVYSYMKFENPGIISVSREYVIGDESEYGKIVDYAKSRKIDLAFIGPEAVLATPLADSLVSEGIRVASPSRNAAMIETSKEFMRGLLQKHGIGDEVRNRTFTDPAELRDWIGKLDSEFVVKPVGLTGGKGVRVMGDHFRTAEEGIAVAEDVLKADGRVLIEEKLVGEEFSLQAFTDGTDIFPMPVAQDYKRAQENDTGPNTGGMGAITDSDFGLPFIAQESVEKAKSILQKIAAAMKNDGSEFRGILYSQFMDTADGPKIVEINSRFADPEGINVLSIMKSSLTEVLQGIAGGKVRRAPEFRHRATVLKYIVPEGYGYDPKPGALSIAEGIEDDSRRVFYASVKGSLNSVQMTGSRALALVGISGSISESSAIVDGMIPRIRGRYYVRKDIGRSEFVESKVLRMKAIKGLS